MTFTTLTDEDLSAAVSLRAAHKTLQDAARAAGVAPSSFSNRLLRAAQRGLDGNVAGKVSAGQIVKGTSTLYDSEGGQVMQWVKTTNERSALDLVEPLKEAFRSVTGPRKAIKAPSAVAADLMTLTPCGDWHVGMYAWGKDNGGNNWDLDLAEAVIGGAVEETAERSPASGTAIVLFGGDMLHADNSDNRTARSGNTLDVDGRYPKVVAVAGRLAVRTVDANLRRHSHVIVRVLPGNHDEHSAVAIAYFLLAWYRNEPRVTVDVDPSLFFWHRFGKVMIGATHGHTVKIGQMPQIMAHRRPEDWGATKHRYIHGFHLHHSSKYASEGGGCISEIHQAPIPQDAWHYGAGFLSGRSLQSITYNRDFGETSRCRVAILDGASIAANDNVPAMACAA